MKKLWTKFLVAVAIAAGFWSLYIGLYLLNPVLPLEKLNRTEGGLVHVYKPLRNVYGAKIRIRTASGEEITYRGTMYDDTKAMLIAMKGKQIAVWSQPYYEAWLPPYYNRFWQVQDGGRVLLSHDGYSTSGELHTLNELGIQSISLANSTGNVADGQGNTRTQLGSYTLTGGATRQMGDFVFQRDTARTLAMDYLDVPDDIAALPNLMGFGNVHDLDQAMVRDAGGARLRKTAAHPSLRHITKARLSQVGHPNTFAKNDTHWRQAA